MDDLLSGMKVMAALVIGLYFLKFWRQTHDRLFAYFSAGFGLFAVNVFLLALNDRASEARPYIFLFRLAGFLLIIVGIIAKNRAESS